MKRMVGTLPCLLFAACATVPSQRISKHPKKVLCAPCASGQNRGAAQAARAVASRPASGERLSAYVPAGAVAALLVRDALLPLDQLDQDPKMRKRLATFLSRTVGVDLTQVQALVVYAMSVSPRAHGAVLFRFDGHLVKKTGLRAPAAGSYRGHALARVDSDLLAALTPQGLVVGDRRGVHAAIDLARGRSKPISASSRLAELAQLDDGTHDLIGSVHLASLPAAAVQLGQFGMRVATVSYGPQRQLTLRIAGERPKLQMSLALLEAVVGALMSTLERKMREAEQGSDVVEGVTAIVSYHQARRLRQELNPRLVDGRLTASYQFPEQGVAMLPMVAAIASAAIPLVKKHLAAASPSGVEAERDRDARTDRVRKRKLRREKKRRRRRSGAK